MSDAPFSPSLKRASAAVKTESNKAICLSHPPRIINILKTSLASLTAKRPENKKRYFIIQTCANKKQTVNFQL
jgi:hypothetical protein